MSKHDFKTSAPARGKPCSTEDPPDHFGLNQRFRESIDWRAPIDREKFDRDDDQVVTMLRAPEQRPGLGLDNRFVACSRKRYRGSDVELDAETHQCFWDNRLANVRPLSGHADFLKAGPVIWKHLGLRASKSRVASMLGLKGVDQKTADAVEMALFNAFNTSADVPDMETVAFALGSFIYASVEHKRLHKNGRFYLPFGDDTAYRLLKPHGFGFN